MDLPGAERCAMDARFVATAPALGLIFAGSSRFGGEPAGRYTLTPAGAASGWARAPVADDVLAT
jgi:hypothetical protein